MSLPNSNKRIAKNTLILYFRMFVLMAINLFTSRVILQTLGVSDYGVYNAVGGIVAMFGILSGVLTTSIMRFITFELGRGDYKRLNHVFSTSLNAMFALSTLVILLGEVIGVWFLNAEMNIPAGRMTAANWVFQCSIITFIINLVSVPYNACIVAHEKMSAFAYVSILDAFLKLAIVFLVSFLPTDKLISYAVFLTIIATIIRLVYGIYCKRNFEECTYHFVYDKALLRSITSFAGWTICGRSAGILSSHGVTLLINLFFGVTVNAARGISLQVSTTIQHFVSNFTMALNPQITKSYAVGDFKTMHSLIFRGAKISYFLMLYAGIPVLCEAPLLLHLWLGIVPPEHTINFIRLTIVGSMIATVNGTLITGLHASGDIRNYMIIVGLVGLSIIPLTFIGFRLYPIPELSYFITLTIYLFDMFLRVYLIKDKIKMKGRDYCRYVFLPIALVSIPSFLIPVGFCFFCSDSVFRLLEICVISFISTSISIYLFGLEKNEKAKIKNVVVEFVRCVKK